MIGRDAMLRLKDVLSEAVMGFLALAALAMGLAPMLFTVSPAAMAAFDIAEWAIIALRSTVALRIVRLFRALLFGVRAGHAVMQPALPPVRGAPLGPPQVTRLGRTEAAPRETHWKALLDWVAPPTGEWLHVSNIPFERWAALSLPVRAWTATSCGAIRCCCWWARRGCSPLRFIR